MFENIPPIHPMFVHFTIALLSAGLLCEILARIIKTESLKNVAWWNLLLGFFAIIGTVITGLIDEESVPHTGEVHEIVEIHETLGLTALGIFILLFLLRTLIRVDILKKYTTIAIIVWIIGVTVIFTGGFFGGKMVYEYGVGVKSFISESAEIQDYEH